MKIEIWIILMLLFLITGFLLGYLLGIHISQKSFGCELQYDALRNISICMAK